MDEEYRKFREESDERVRRLYAQLGGKALPPKYGSPTWREEHHAYRQEADERLREIREQLERNEAEAAARREAAGGESG
jgi:hypothetical protein